MQAELFEKPLYRVGDLVRIGGRAGQIKRIGADGRFFVTYQGPDGEYDRWHDLDEIENPPSIKAADVTSADDKAKEESDSVEPAEDALLESDLSQAMQDAINPALLDEIGPEDNYQAEIERLQTALNNLEQDLTDSEKGREKLIEEVIALRDARTKLEATLEGERQYAETLRQELDSAVVKIKNDLGALKASAVAPVAMIRTEIRTLIQDDLMPAGKKSVAELDNELATYINEGWAVLHMQITSVWNPESQWVEHSRIITLARDEQPEPVREPMREAVREPIRNEAPKAKIRVMSEAEAEAEMDRDRQPLTFKEALRMPGLNVQQIMDIANREVFEKVFADAPIVEPERELVPLLGGQS